MDENQLDDLKQFISATVSQATAGMATKDDISNMATKDDLANMATKNDLAELSVKIDDLDLKLDTISETLQENLNDHEARITQLEHQTA
jgi:hypothetical protein